LDKESARAEKWFEVHRKEMDRVIALLAQKEYVSVDELEDIRAQRGTEGARRNGELDAWRPGPPIDEAEGPETTPAGGWNAPRGAPVRDRQEKILRRR
jgi:hypothetical protein